MGQYLPTGFYLVQATFEGLFPCKSAAEASTIAAETEKVDGSLDVFIQHASPSDAKQQANWLPAPEAGFYLNLRLYVPDDSLQKGTWKPPVVRVVE
jgi:hypothetical protein